MLSDPCALNVVKVEHLRVAVILPVYNIAPYLRECIGSLLWQTYLNLTIFAIDDGSTDGSGAILDEYGGRDNRIVVKHKKNGGVSSARNMALDAMDACREKFDVVCFVDGDDIIAPEFVQKYVELMIAYSADYVACGWQAFDRKGVCPCNKKTHPLFLTDGNGAYQHFFSQGCWSEQRFSLLLFLLQTDAFLLILLKD